MKNAEEFEILDKLRATGRCVRINGEYTGIVVSVTPVHYSLRLLDGYGQENGFCCGRTRCIRKVEHGTRDLQRLEAMAQGGGLPPPTGIEEICLKDQEDYIDTVLRHAMKLSCFIRVTTHGGDQESTVRVETMRAGRVRISEYDEYGELLGRFGVALGGIQTVHLDDRFDQFMRACEGQLL